MKEKQAIDMANGPLLGNIWRFSVPLMLSGALQLLYNTVNSAVISKGEGEEALAAVGGTGAITNLIVLLFMGLSVGAGVVVSQACGAGDREKLSKAVHTAVLVSLIGGVITGLVGVVFCRPLLVLMGTPDKVIDLAALYICIYFCGMPAVGLYNFCAAVLRSVGDTKRPMYFLLISGAVHVLLNLLFVLVLHMGVVGSALSTILSQSLSAFLTLHCLMHKEGAERVSLKALRIDKESLQKILVIGIPAGLQSSLYSVSNMVTQSAINSFGELVMAGDAAAINIDGFVGVILSAFSQAAVTFVGQNVGANRWNRVSKVVFTCMGSIFVACTAAGLVLLLLGRTLLTNLFSTDPQVIEAGLTRLSWIAPTYFLYGWMESLGGGLRGMGKSILPTVTSMIGICGLRSLWVYTVFRMRPQLSTIYMVCPISWATVTVVLLVCFLLIYRKKYRQWQSEMQEEATCA